MPCYSPLYGYYSKTLNPTGKRSIVFNQTDGGKRLVQLPCGRCIGCKLEKARQWALRCIHESKLYDDNVFVTLTYSDANVPRLADGRLTLHPRDMVLFMKKLRHYAPGVRFFQCGEYGDTTERPHHHAILFNCRFPDGKLHSTSGASPLYTSRELDKLWSLGQCTFGDVTFDSAGYVARYALKKVVQDKANDGRVPEYLTMSRRPGIGYEWFRQHKVDFYRNDTIVVNGVESRPPRYYDMKCEQATPSVMRRVKAARVRKAEEMAFSRSEQDVHLDSSRVIKEASISLLSRNLG